MGNKRKAHNASSGYFSALDQTDFEDMGSTSTAAQSMQTASQVPFIPGSHLGIAPMIVMNNLVLKQPNFVTPALKPWSLNPLVDVVPQSQFLLLQPVMHTGDCTSQSADKLKHSRKCIPMQNTFPKIAPHPAHMFAVDLGPGVIKKKPNHSGRQQRCCHNDRGFQSLKQDETFKHYGVHPNVDSWDKLNHNATDIGMEDFLSRPSDPQEPHTTISPFSLCPDSALVSYPEKCSKATVSLTSLLTIHSSDVENIPEALSPSSSKCKRFCNTYNILNRSGLLGITLHTKELILQNKRSQAQLQSLQAQTDLFLEAICSGDPKAWTRLQLTLQNPGDCEETVQSVRDVGEDVTAVGCMM